jgi:hypothetical protein
MWTEEVKSNFRRHDKTREETCDMKFESLRPIVKRFRYSGVRRRVGW